MLKSNGLRHPKNLPVKFGFSPIDISANIAKKLPPQRCFKPLLIAIFNFPHKRPTFAFAGESGTHSAFGEGSHTTAYTPKHGVSFLPPHRAFRSRSHIWAKNSRRKRMHACGVCPLPPALWFPRAAWFYCHLISSSTSLLKYGSLLGCLSQLLCHLGRKWQPLFWSENTTSGLLCL